MEGKAITTEMMRNAVKVEDLVPDAAELRKRTIPWRLVTCLQFSFRSVKEINYLVGLDCLTKLHLDNNHLSEIKNIGHLTNLTHLDLSFNEISKIEGLETLTKLVDLSLFSNKIERLEGMETLEEVISLSVGNNLLQELEDVMYFRQFRKLRLLCLEGNPLSKDYRYYTIAFVRNLLYLDHKLCFKKQITAAREQFQDDLTELKSTDIKEDLALAARNKRREELQLLKNANLDGLDDLFDNMLAEDPEYPKLSEVPTLLTAHEEFRAIYSESTKNLKETLIDLHYKIEAIIKEWRSTQLDGVKKRDEESRVLVRNMDKTKEKVFGEALEDRTAGDVNLRNLLAENDKLKEQLMETEIICFDEVQNLWVQFHELHYTLFDSKKQHFANYFGTLRTSELKSSETIAMHAASLVEKYVLQDMEEDVESEIARELLKDKEVLMMAVAASKDAHTLKIDTVEDEKIKTEENARRVIIEDARMASIKRNRERLQEIWFVHETNLRDIEAELRRYQRSELSHRCHSKLRTKESKVQL